MEVVPVGWLTEYRVSFSNNPAKSLNLNPIKRKHQADSREAQSTNEMARSLYK